jgi:hypothetical protein
VVASENARANDGSPKPRTLGNDVETQTGTRCSAESSSPVNAAPWESGPLIKYFALLHRGLLR